MKSMKYDFSQVYAKYKDKIWGLISKYAPARHDREDLFQEIFLKVHKNLDRFRGDSDIGTWLFRIAVNEAINFGRKKGRLLKLEQVVEKLNIFKKAQEPEEIEEDIRKWAPLKVLNQKQKLILIMAEVEEIKMSDIAKYMKISEGTVKSNLFRAKEILRKEIEKGGGIYG
ncbi:MAG: sigma-70 family RNA polymerase sigma factor [Candidatus Margulisiibacteriota bacterium]